MAAEDNVEDFIARRLERGLGAPIRRPQPDAVDFDGGGPHPPDMEARVAKLEATMDHVQSDVSDLKRDVRSDFRWIIGGIGASFVLLAGALATGYLRLADQIGQVADQVAIIVSKLH